MTDNKAPERIIAWINKDGSTQFEGDKLFPPNVEVEYVRADLASMTPAQAAKPPTFDPRPANCRFRLKDEGKAYPRSSCQACGKIIATGLGNSCWKLRVIAEGKN